MYAKFRKEGVKYPWPNFWIFAVLLLVSDIISIGELAADTAEIAASLRQCRVETRYRDAIVSSLKTKCGALGDDANQLPGNFSALLPAVVASTEPSVSDLKDLEVRLIGQSLENAFLRYYEIEVKHFGAQPLQILDNYCKFGCSLEMRNRLSKSLNLALEHPVQPMTSSQVAKNLNRDVVKANRRLRTLEKAMGSGQSKVGTVYNEYAWSFFDSEGYLLGTKTGQDIVGKINGLPVNYGNLANGKSTKDYFPRHREVTSAQIPSLTVAALNSVTGDSKYLFKMDGERVKRSGIESRKSYHTSLKELIRLYPLSAGQVLASSPNLTKDVCEILKSIDLDESSNPITKSLNAVETLSSVYGTIVVGDIAASALGFPPAVVALPVLLAGSAALGAVSTGLHYLNHRREASHGERLSSALGSGSGNSMQASEYTSRRDSAQRALTAAKVSGVFTALDLGALMAMAKPAVSAGKVLTASERAVVEAQNLARLEQGASIVAKVNAATKGRLSTAFSELRTRMNPERFQKVIINLFKGSKELMDRYLTKLANAVGKTKEEMLNGLERLEGVKCI